MATAVASLPSDDQIQSLIKQNAKRTRSLFADTESIPDPKSTETADKLALVGRVHAEYDHVRELPAALAAKQAAAAGNRRKKAKVQATDGDSAADNNTMKMIEGIPSRIESSGAGSSTSLIIRGKDAPPNANGPSISTAQSNLPSSSLVRKQNFVQAKPEWHAPWKLMRVISGHLGWVRALAVEPENRWFASGAGDRTIKIWDLATGGLKLTLTGHISTVRGLAVSPRHPYLFSCGEDKMVKCWDLETNKVIRHYHGHLSGVYTLALHPTLDVLVTGGRDGVARVWDMRTRSNIHVLSGHKGTVSDLKCQEADPQVITSSLDSTVRLWDLAAGKSVRALAIHPKEFTFASGSAGSIKQWKCPEGAFMQNFDGQNAIINTLSVNEDNVLFSGGDNGSMAFWDWKTGHRYQALDSIAQPGSLDAEAGIFTSLFDKTGLRLITGEADKTIKVWKQDELATPESHPLEWKPELGRRKF
ncbi:pre-mRNA splicing factor prp46 [Botrytis cinerea]